MSDLFNMHVSQIAAKNYSIASKKTKMTMIDEYCKVSNVSRNLASKRFINSSKNIYPIILKINKPKAKRGPKLKYSRIHKSVIKKVWELFDCICAERLLPMVSKGITELKFAGVLDIYDVKVLSICRNVSLGTLKNVIAQYPKPKGFRKRNRKPGIYTRVPIEANFNKYASKPGFIEVDPVEHTGSNKNGKYAITGCYVCIFSQWIARSSALRQNFAAIESIHDKNSIRFYHKIHKYHCDNAKALLKVLFKRVCGENVSYDDEKVVETLSRSRAYKKEDNGHVEQKNGDKVRKIVGYHRYDSVKQVDLLNKLYLVEDLITNFFIPSQKLKKKFYDDNGRLIRKEYDIATTPYQRLIRSKQVDEMTKIRLKDKYKCLNLVELRRKSERMKSELSKTVLRK